MISIIKLVLGKRNGKLVYKFVNVHRRFVNPLSFAHTLRSEQFVSSNNKWLKASKRGANTFNRNRVYRVTYLILYDFSSDMWHVIGLQNARNKKGNGSIVNLYRRQYFIERNIYNLGIFCLLCAWIYVSQGLVFSI